MNFYHLQRGLPTGRKKRSTDLGPLDARCFCEGEICCRHPEYKDVPLEINPGTLGDVSGYENCTTTTKTTTTTNKLTITKPKQTTNTGKPTTNNSLRTTTNSSTNRSTCFPFKSFKFKTYSCVQKCWNEVFFKILTLPSIVQKKRKPHMNAKLIFIGEKKLKIEDPKTKKIQLHQHPIYHFGTVDIDNNWHRGML